MATVASLPFAKIPKGYNKESKERERSSKTKQPTRAMTHPIHDPAKASMAANRRVKNGEPFDPDELTRRLAAYVAEQKLASQRRREARAAKERAAAVAAAGFSSSPLELKNSHDGVYHHVPTVAAAAFQRTATPILVTPETVHKLSAPVLKAALSPHNPDDSFDELTLPTRQKSTKRPGTSLQRTILHDQAEVEQERIRNRNQFSQTRALEEAAEVDELRDVYRLPIRTFGEFAHLRTANGKSHTRPLSTGDVFSDSEDTDSAPGTRARLKTVRVKPVYEGRNDWAQEEVTKCSAEREKGNGRTVKERVSGPFLRRKESVWVMMGKKEKHKVDDALVGTGIGESSSPPPLDGKRGFLARFKRQPS